jgi:hypothetical protein
MKVRWNALLEGGSYGRPAEGDGSLWQYVE